MGYAEGRTKRKFSAKHPEPSGFTLWGMNRTWWTGLKKKEERGRTRHAPVAEANGRMRAMVSSSRDERGKTEVNARRGSPPALSEHVATLRLTRRPAVHPNSIYPATTGIETFVMFSARWIKHAIVAFTVAFAILLIAALLRDRPLQRAVKESVLWAAVSTSVFIGSRMYGASKGRPCALCGDGGAATKPRAESKGRRGGEPMSRRSSG